MNSTSRNKRKFAGRRMYPMTTEEYLADALIEGAEPERQ